MMDHLLGNFVTRLAQAPLDGPANNHYAPAPGDPLLDQANGIRRENLRLYLDYMQVGRPWLLLVGEAPGYRGCRLTGVPFTSEAIILNRHIWPFGPQAGFRKTAERATVVKEASATIVWSALDGQCPPPLLWNAFPFHPHQAGQPNSNRRPYGWELQVGATFLKELIDLFRPQAIAAVGRSAARALELAGLNMLHALRHPSHGGKNEFVAGLAQIQPRITGRAAGPRR